MREINGGMWNPPDVLEYCEQVYGQKSQGGTCRESPSSGGGSEPSRGAGAGRAACAEHGPHSDLCSQEEEDETKVPSGTQPVAAPRFTCTNKASNPKPGDILNVLSNWLRK